MEGKRDVIYLSSNEALVKIFVLVLTIGISILASLLDYKSCYTTILVQACNNMYDFYSFTDNKKYTTMVRRESIVIIENNWHTVRKKEYFLEKCSFFCGTKNWHETCSIYKYQ